MPANTYTVETNNLHIKLLNPTNTLTAKMTIDVNVAQRYYGAIRGYSLGYDYKEKTKKGIALNPPLALGIGL